MLRATTIYAALTLTATAASYRIAAEGSRIMADADRLGITTQAESLRSSCVLWLSGDRDTHTTVYDLSPAGNNATQTTGGNMPQWDAEAGGCWRFEGNDYWSVADHATLDTGSAFTFALWINLPTLPNDAAVIAKRSDASTYWWDMTIGNTSPYYVVFKTTTASGTVAAYTNGPTVHAQGWVHLAGTYDGTTMKLYKNGAVIAFAAQTGTANNDVPVTVGRSTATGAGGAHCYGKIDDVRVYNRALSQVEVQAVMGENTPHSIVLARYVMLYNGKSVDQTRSQYWSGLAWSPDSERWRLSDGDTVFTNGAAGSWKAKNTKEPSRITVGPDGKYWGAYAAQNSAKKWQIGVAWSADLLTWTDAGNNPVISNGATYDSVTASFPKLWYEADAPVTSRWRMIYCGAAGYTTDVCYAYGSSPTNLIKYAGNPVFNKVAASWEKDALTAGDVVKHGGAYHLFYCGRSNILWKSGVAVAASPEGPWTRSAANPIAEGRTESDQLLAANANSGASSVTVSDGSDYIEGETVIVDDKNSVIAIRKITDIAGNVLTLDRTLTEDYTTAQDARCRGIYSKSTMPSTVMQADDGTYRMYGLVYNLFNCESNELYEWCTMLSGPTLTNDFSVMHERGILAYRNSTNGWQHTSLDNNAVLRMPTPVNINFGARR